MNQAFITVKKGDAGDAGKIFTISKANTIIGRRTPQYVPDIDLNDEVVSRRHIEIVVQGREIPAAGPWQYQRLHAGR